VTLLGDVVPSTPQLKSAPEIAEMAPQVARARAIAVTKTAPSRRLQPGDLICGTCGEGNPSTRRFCSRCGASLIEAVQVKEPWWRRLLRKLTPRRGPKVVKIGSRKYGPDDGKPGGAARLAKPIDVKGAVRRILRIVRMVLAVVILLGGVLYAAYPPLRNAVNGRYESVKTSITDALGDNLSPIHAVSVTANSTVKGSSPLYAADELLNTYWLAPWSDSSQPVLTFKFSRHVTLLKMILHSGAYNNFVQIGRPASLLLSFSNGETLTLTPQDTAQAQTLNISHADLITSVQIQVTGIYPGYSGSDVAITEIEWFGYNT
jgi:hypothetical protein